MATDDAVERLAGGIAHDFDGLLTDIIDHIGQLSEYLSPGDPRSRHLAAIRDAADRGARLTAQLLAFSRAQELRPRVVDLNTVVARAAHALRRVLGERIALEVRPAADLRLVRVDAARVEQILHDLAANARDAMPSGGRVEVATANVHLSGEQARRRGLEAGDYVALSLTDSGAGVDAALQPHLFEPFVTAAPRASLSRLGLAMVSGIVKQSGGAIGVESPLADGTPGSRFTVHLPVAASPREAETDAETVLLVGDDRNMQAFIGNVLRRRGYRLMAARDPWHALRLAGGDAARIDLLITAGSDAGAVASVLRQWRPELRVLHVAASGESSPREAEDRHDLPHAVLPVPFTPADLAATVRRVMADEGPRE
jgi:two-component system, cell cycle sensor histidine kinase and response regulator CckA